MIGTALTLRPTPHGTSPNRENLRKTSHRGHHSKLRAECLNVTGSRILWMLAKNRRRYAQASLRRRPTELSAARLIDLHIPCATCLSPGSALRNFTRRRLKQAARSTMDGPPAANGGGILWLDYHQKFVFWERAPGEKSSKIPSNFSGARGRTLTNWKASAASL